VANIPTEDVAERWRAGCECARAGLCYRCQAAREIENLASLLSTAQDRNAKHCAEVQRLQERESEVAKIIARALACDDYRAQHAEWMADAARWLNNRRAS
jgi:hypothetical protein